MSAVRLIAPAAWLAVGAALVWWLATMRDAPSAALWFAVLAPVVALLPALLLSWRNAHAYAMLACIPYATLGTMDVVATGARVPAAVAVTAASLAAFFVLIPLVRRAAR